MQSEQFSLLSRGLETFRQHAGKVDLLGGSVTSLDGPSSPGKPFPQFMNGLAPSIGSGECLEPHPPGLRWRGWPVTPARAVSGWVWGASVPGHLALSGVSKCDPDSVRAQH